MIGFIYLQSTNPSPLHIVQYVCHDSWTYLALDYASAVIALEAYGPLVLGVDVGANQTTVGLVDDT